MSKKGIIGLVAGILCLGAAVAAIIIYFSEIEEFFYNIKYRIEDKICSLKEAKCNCAEEEYSDFADL